MEFVSTRELRVSPGPILQRLQVGEHEVVVTSHGKPVALLVGITDDNFEETVQLLRQARAQLAASRLRAHAQQQGLDGLDAEAIEAEIQTARAVRRPA